MTPERDVVYSATAIAARLGVAVETLRTWDRRYGIGPTGPAGRGAGGRRLYGERDVERLLTMRRLVSGGTPTAEAARLALAAADSVSEDSAAEPGRVPAAGTAQRALLRMASRLDGAAVDHLLRESIAARGVESTWDELLRPALATLGSRWQETGEGVEVEHLLSLVAGNVLQSVAADPLARGSGVRSPVQSPILLAAVDGEQHVLTLGALAAALAEQGIPSISLGASTPAVALTLAVQRLRPGGIFLWARGWRESVDEVGATITAWRGTRSRRPLRVAVGGEGWADVDLPAEVSRVGSLGEAIRAMTG